jgi:hypothetical protein
MQVKVGPLKLVKGFLPGFEAAIILDLPTLLFATFIALLKDLSPSSPFLDQLVSLFKKTAYPWDMNAVLEVRHGKSRPFNSSEPFIVNNCSVDLKSSAISARVPRMLPSFKKKRMANSSRLD